MVLPLPNLRRHHNLLGSSPITGPIVKKGGGRTAGKKVGRVVSVGHRYWGISISATNEDPAGNVDVAELRFFDDTGACISDGLTGFAKAGWTGNSGKAASDGLSDGLTGTLEIASYTGGSLPMIYWFDFGSPVNPALMQVVGVTEEFNASCPKDFAMVYSDDALAWTAVASTTDETDWQYNEDRTLENPDNAPAWTGQNAFASTQWTVRMEDYYSSYFGWGMAELEFYETIGGEKVVPVSIAASDSLGGYPPSNLIDGNAGTFWTTSGSTPAKNVVNITATFASPVSIAQIGMRARPDSDDQIGRQMPKEVRVSYEDGATRKYAGYIIDPAPSFAAPGELRKYPLLIAR